MKYYSKVRIRENNFLIGSHTGFLILIISKFAIENPLDTCIKAYNKNMCLFLYIPFKNPKYLNMQIFFPL